MKSGGLFTKKTLRDVPLRGKTILVRADYNVPLTRDGEVADDFRIRSSVPTIQALLKEGCRIVIISHLGRPDGKRDTKYSLEPAAQRLAQLLKHDVRFIDQCVGHKVYMAVKRAPNASVTVLENLRFHPEEEANDEDFARQLAKQTHADYFVQDGFGVVHRAHASTDAITRFLPSVAGLLFDRGGVKIRDGMQSREHPLVAVFGGAKASDKIPVIKALIPIADTIVLAGAMANTFLAHQHVRLGKSKVETGQDEIIDEIYRLAEEKVGKSQVKDFLILPTDLGVGTSIEPAATRRDVSIHAVTSEMLALDIGPESATKMLEKVHAAKTVIWNGTLGMCEVPAFRAASIQLATALIAKDAPKSLIGGGDTSDFVINWDERHGDSFPYISTGGGASLELMSGAKLPGVETLLDD